MGKKTYKPFVYCQLYDNILKNETKPIVFYDTETTGVKKNKDFIVQISAVKFVKQSDGYRYSGEKLNIYIKPPIPMPLEASKVNHITDDMLADCPTEEEAFLQIKEFFGDPKETIVSGYNLKFDNSFMNEMYLRCEGVPYEPFAVIDVMLLARELVDRKDVSDNTYKLSSVGELYGLKEDNMHSSDTDTFVTTMLLKYLMDEYRGMEIPNYKERPKLKISNVSEFKKGKTANYLMIYVTGMIGEEFVTGHLHYDKWNYQYVEDAGDLFDRFDMEQLAKDVDNFSKKGRS